jgi:alpha-N-arabinofuranosidase
MTALLVIWDRLSFDGIVSGDNLDPYIDDGMNELEFILGSTSTTYGALRVP